MSRHIEFITITYKVKARSPIEAHGKLRDFLDMRDWGKDVEVLSSDEKWVDD